MIGADEVYLKEWTWDNINELYYIMERPYEPKFYRKYIYERYNFEKLYPKIEELVGCLLSEQKTQQTSKVAAEL